MKRQPLALPIAALSILLCAFAASPARRSEQDLSLTTKIITSIGSEGSGMVMEEVFFSTAALDWLKSLGPDFSDDEMCSGFISGLEETAIWTKEESDSGMTCKSKQFFSDLGELETLMTKFSPVMSFDRLEITEGRLYYDLVPNFDSTGESDEAVPIKSEASWILVLPGDVVETNADKTEGRTLTWDLMKVTKSSHFRAECKLGGGLLGLDPTLMAVGAVVLLLCCCVVLVIAAGAAFFFLRRKNERPRSKLRGIPHPAKAG